MFYIKIGIKLFCKLIPILLLARARHAQMTQNDKSIISLQYLKKKKRGLNSIYCMEINIPISYDLRLSILVGMASHAQSTQSKKFAKY